MKKKRILIKGLILILGMSLFFSSMIFAGPNENAGIVFDLDATTYGNQNLASMPSQPAGTYIRLDVYCTGVQNLDTYEFEVIYDQTELSYVASSATNPITYEPNILTTNGGTAIGWMVDTSTPGVLSIAYTLAGTDILEAPEGEGLIADIVLQALVPSRDLLTFGDVLFLDSFGVMDIITNKGVALLSQYGNIDGTVTDTTNGEPIEDALITATSQGKFEYTGFTNADGYYIIDSLIAGDYIVICDAVDQGYNIAYAYNVEIIADDTTNVDFALTSPIMVVAPLEIFPIVENMGGSTITDITLSNIGTGPLDWHGTIVVPEQLREPLKIEFPTPPSSNYCAPIKVAPSLGFAPEIIHTNHSEPVVNLTRGSTGWAYDSYPGHYFYSFDTDDPETANIIAYTDWDAFAGDFDSGSDDDATYYIIKYPENIFAWVDIETGIATDIGPIIGSGGSYMWTGISCDKSTGIMYAVETDINFTNLYTIDLATGTPTLIGATGIPGVIDIAVDGEGLLWGYCIVGDMMYTIDTATGASTLIGPIGFDANYAQGMSWDPETDQVYLTAYGTSGEFRVLDRETGYCAYVGPLPNNGDICALGFIGVPWIIVEPISGTIEPGGDEIVQATVYWLEALLPGQVKYADIVFTSDPDCGEQTVNVTATFGPDIPGSISGLVTLESTPYSSGNVEDVLITAVSQVFPNIYYFTAYPNSTGEYTIQGIYPGTYDIIASLLYDYEDSTIVDVEVEEAANTPNIDFELNCLLGALQGTVTDGYGEPIEGATITAQGDLPPSGPYYATTNNVGYYEINPIIAQEYDLTCVAAGFDTYTAEIEVLLDEILIHDIIMVNPTIDVTPEFVTITLNPNTQGTEFLTISNDGNTPLEWYANIEFPEALIIDIPPSSGDFPMGNYKTSIGMPPEDGVATVQSSAPIIDFMRGATAYGIVAGYEFFCSFDTDEPEVLNNIAAYTGPAFSNAGDFGVGDQSFVYELDNASNLRTIDLDTGVATVIGNPLPTGAETWSGMSTDPTTGTIYASTTDMYNSSLFTIDPETATSTLIGSIGFPSVVGIAVDGNGDMWGYCLVQDEFFSIDKETGLGTLVGSIGFDANYGQGMTWDVETDQLYMSAFNNAPFQAELRIVDRETGNTVMVGVLGATSHEHCQLGWMAIPGFGGPRWITVDPSSGTVAPGGDSLVAVYFDAIDQLPGTILTADIHFFSIPNVGNPIIPVTLTVDDIDVTGEPEILVTGLYDNFPNPFSLFTTIRFSLKEAAHVKLSVYNIRGQLVNRLIDEDMVAGADYQVKWDGTSNDKKLTNGIYFYKFETGNETFLKKTILMK